MSIDWLNRRRSSKSSLAIVSGVFLLGLLVSTIIALTLYKTERNLLEYALASEVEERNNSLSKEFDIILKRSFRCLSYLVSIGSLTFSNFKTKQKISSLAEGHFRKLFGFPT